MLQGITEDPSGNWHEIDRFIIIFIGMLAFKLYKELNFKNKILNILLSYTPSLLLTFAYVFMCGLRSELASSAYKDIFMCYTGCYIIILAVYSCIKKLRNKKTL